MRYLTLAEVLELHQLLVQRTGGAAGVRDFGALESAIAQARLSFQGADFYPEIEDKAAALGYSIISGHPFVDGNKRVGHAAMEVLLLLNNRRLDASVDDSEHIVLEIANGRCSRDQLAHWLRAHTSPISTDSP